MDVKQELENACQYIEKKNRHDFRGSTPEKFRWICEHKRFIEAAEKLMEKPGFQEYNQEKKAAEFWRLFLSDDNEFYWMAHGNGKEDT